MANGTDPPASLPYSAIMLKGLLAAAQFCTFREHRVLMAYAVRADEHGVAWPSVEQIAKDTGLPVRHVKSAIKSLLLPAAEGKQQRAREPLIETLSAGGGNGNSARRRLLISDLKTVTGLVTLNSDRSGQETVTDPALNSDRSGQETVTGSVLGRGQGRGNEEDKEESPAAPAASNRPPAKVARVKSADVAAIYAAYPVKKKPHDAERAIGKALDVVARRPVADLGGMTPADWLLVRTTIFAAARERCIAAGTSEPRFTPYPATWFNARSYDEDPATWEPPHTRANNGTKTFRKGPNDGLARGIGKLPKRSTLGRDSGGGPGGGSVGGHAADGHDVAGGTGGGG